MTFIWCFPFNNEWHCVFSAIWGSCPSVPSTWGTWKLLILLYSLTLGHLVNSKTGYYVFQQRQNSPLMKVKIEDFLQWICTQVMLRMWRCAKVGSAKYLGYTISNWLTHSPHSHHPLHTMPHSARHPNKVSESLLYCTAEYGLQSLIEGRTTTPDSTQSLSLHM